MACRGANQCQQKPRELRNNWTNHRYAVRSRPSSRKGYTLPPGKTRYPFYKRLGGPQGRSGRAENLVPTGTRSRTSSP